MRRWWGMATVAILVLLATGCSDGDDSSTAGDAGRDMDAALGADESVQATAAAGSASGAGGERQSARDAVSAALDLPPIGRDVVRTAELRVEVETGTFAERLRTVSNLARSLGGFVESSATSSFAAGEASGEVTIRVPVDRYDEAMDRLAELGELSSVVEDGEDVTDQLVDLDARLRALRAEEAALNGLLARAANVEEILSVRATAIGIRQQIEQLAARQASLADRAALSTIRVVLHEGSTEAIGSRGGGDDWGLADAVRTAIDAAERVVGAAIVGLGVLAPVLPLVAAGWWLSRRNRRPLAAPE